MKVPEALWREAPKLARVMSQDSWQGPGVRFHLTSHFAARAVVSLDVDVVQ
jgi:hypothetical protein